VEESFKRRLPARLKVAGPDPLTCGMATIKGEREAYIIYEYEPGRYASSMCSSVDPVELRFEARPLPPTVDGGTPAFIVGGAFGEVRTIALDASGRTVAYGRGEGTVEDLKICPGGRRLVERVFGDDAVSTIAVRALPSLRTLSELPIPHQINNIDVVSVGCLDDHARDVAVFWSDLPYGKQGGFIWRRDGKAWRRTAVGRHVSRAEFIGSTAYLTSAGPAPRLISYDLKTGARRLIAPVPPQSGNWVLSPDRRSIAGITLQSPRERLPRLTVVDLGGPRTVTSRDLGAHAKHATVEWITKDQLAVLPSTLADQRVRIFDASLRRLTVWDDPWEAALKSVVGKRVYGVVEDPRYLASVRLSDGHGQRVISHGRIETGVFTIVYVEDAIRAGTSSRKMDPLTDRLIDHTTSERERTSVAVVTRPRRGKAPRPSGPEGRIPDLLAPALVTAGVLTALWFATRNRFRRRPQS